jgi:SAM-dependent methyltransferase
MAIYRISPMRWLRRIALAIIAVTTLTWIFRRLRQRSPEPLPARFAPLLGWPLRWRLFGTPEQILDRAGVTPGMQVLEVGPGPGFFTIPLARRVAALGKGGRVTCVELQPAMIALLRERLREAEVDNVTIIAGNGQRMPLPDNTFDLVFLVDVLGETPDMPALFRECARVLKPGGKLAVTESSLRPDFHPPSAVRALATGAALTAAGQVGLPWWIYTAHYRKPAI